MRYDGKTYDGISEVTRLHFHANKDEVKSLHDIAKEYLRITPRTTDTLIFRRRMTNIMKTMGSALVDYKRFVPKL